VFQSFITIEKKSLQIPVHEAKIFSFKATISFQEDNFPQEEVVLRFKVSRLNIPPTNSYCEACDKISRFLYAAFF